MRRKLMQFIKFVFDYGLLLVALIAFLLQVLNDFGLPLPESFDKAQFIFYGVGLLLISTLWERRMILGEIDGKLDKFMKGIVPASLILKTEKNEIPFSKYMEESGEVSICGATLSSTIRNHRNEFLRLARKGIRFRFLLVDPVAFPNEQEEKMLFKKTALIEFSKLLRDAPQGKVEVRLMDRYPSNKITIFNSDRPGLDLILVEMFGYQTSKTDRPFFFLYENQDPHWFTFFKEMYDSMWKDARPYIGHAKTEQGGQESG